MKAASDLSVLEFSPAHSGGAERGEGFIGRTWPGNPDSSPGGKLRWGGVGPVSNIPFAAWENWSGRGIPELASPLAD